MSSPFEVLGISADADEAQIRDRYLQLVREFPPDRAPERFAEIRAAVDELQNPIPRLERRLFSLTTTDSIKAIESDLHSRLLKARLSVGDLIKLAEVR